VRLAVHDHRPAGTRALRRLLALLCALLVLLACGPARAIQNCHDYTYYALTGRDGAMMAAGTLRNYLAQNGYTRYRYTDARALAGAGIAPMTEQELLQPGDVLLFGDSHSGIVTAQRTVNHYFQTFVSAPVPGRVRATNTVDPRDMDYEVLKGWSVARILKEKRYRQDQIEVWRAPAKDEVQFDATWYEAAKDAGQVNLKLIRSGLGKGPITVRISSEPIVSAPDASDHYDGASAGRSYRLPVDTVSWDNGDKSPKPVTVTILNNDLESGDRGVRFKLALQSGPARLGYYDSARLLLRKAAASADRSQMGGDISFTEDQVQALAARGSVRLVVAREGYTKGAVSVQFETQDDSAMAGADYAPVSGTLSWLDGDNSVRTLDVPILASGAPATESRFMVRLVRPSGGAQLARPSQVTVILQRPPAPGVPTPAVAVDPTRPPSADQAPPDQPLEPPTPPPQRTPQCRYLRITPDKIEVTSARQVVFQAIAVFTDGSELDVTRRAEWQPGPGNSYTAPPDLRFNQQVTITARWRGCEGGASINALAPSWSPPLSHADDLGARGETPAPADYVWYALCDQSGQVVTGHDPSPTQFGILAGPFPGPRGAEQWIPQNCPSKLCTKTGASAVCAQQPPLAPTGGDAYYALCNASGQIVISRAATLAGHITMSPALTGEAGARFWIQTNCPSQSCTRTGACAGASQIRGGGKWAVVCSKAHGGVGLTEYPSIVDSWVLAEHLLSDRDAKNWIAQHCPSERCDGNGRCLAGGPPAPATLPLGLPPGDPLDLYRQRDSSRTPGGRAGSAATGSTARPGRFGLETLGGTPIPERTGTGTGTGTGSGTGSGPGTGTGTGPVVIPTCTTDRDCPGAKCVNNVCTQAPPGTGSTTPSTPVQPATPQTLQWYVLEAVAGFTTNAGVSGAGITHEDCKVTYWAAYGLWPSELQGRLRSIEKDVLSLAAVPLSATNPSVRLLSSRVYQGPSASELKPPAWPPYKLQCSAPY